MIVKPPIPISAVPTVISPVPCTNMNTVSVVPLTKAEPSAVPTPATVKAESPAPSTPCDVVIYCSTDFKLASVRFEPANLRTNVRPLTPF